MATISLESVTAAAESIVASGGTPSLRLVREHLGGGSPNVILPLLRQWKEGQARKAAPSDQAVAAVQESTQRLYQAALEQARAEMRTDLEVAVRERDEARAEADVREAEVEELRDLLAENGKELGQARAQVSDLAAARDGIETVARTMREVAGHHAQSLVAVEAAQRDQGQRITSTLAALDRQLSDQRIIAGRIERRMDEMETRLAGLADAVDRSLSACASARTAVEALRTAIDDGSSIVLRRMESLDGGHRRLAVTVEKTAVRQVAMGRRLARLDRLRH